jgi:hypothetical protein
VQFLLVDVGSTLVFLLGYLTVVGLQRRRAVAAPGAATRMLNRGARLVPYAGASKASETRNPAPAARQSRREWPRLSHPR